MADEDGKLVGVIGDEDTVTGFLLAGVGHRTMEGANFLVVKNGKRGGGGRRRGKARGRRRRRRQSARGCSRGRSRGSVKEPKIVSLTRPGRKHFILQRCMGIQAGQDRAKHAVMTLALFIYSFVHSHIHLRVQTRLLL